MQTVLLKVVPLIMILTLVSGCASNPKKQEISYLPKIQNSQDQEELSPRIIYEYPYSVKNYNKDTNVITLSNGESYSINELLKKYVSQSNDTKKTEIIFSPLNGWESSDIKVLHEWE